MSNRKNIDAEFLTALTRHLGTGLLALSADTIADVIQVDVRDDVLSDATLVLVTIRVQPAFNERKQA